MRGMRNLQTAFVLIAGAAAFAADLAPVASPEPGWPQLRGPRRDGISAETGLLRSWPEGGPRVIWTATGLGRGWTCPAISGGRMFLAGDEGDDAVVRALDTDGKHLWRAVNGRSWKGPYPGARSVPTVAAGRVYHLNAHGRVACLDTASGREVWGVDALARFGAREIRWGIAECLLVDGDHVIVTPGGEKAAMAALDARTGETAWACEPVYLDARAGDRDAASYASPVLLEAGGARLIAGFTSRHAIGVDAASGRLLWKRRMPTSYDVIAHVPVAVGDALFVTAPDGGGGRLLRLAAEAGKWSVREAWTTSMDTCHGGAILAGDFLLGTWYRAYNGWGCIDARTGKVLHRTKEMPMGSVLRADGRFWCLAQDGTMALVEADAREFRIVSRFRFAEAENDAWAHPVILDGRLYLRYHDRLECRDVRERKEPR
jgi:outer membrane protein assembly factor BamB